MLFSRQRCLVADLLLPRAQELFECTQRQPPVPVARPLASNSMPSSGQPTTQVHATAVRRVQHALGWDAAVGIEHAVRIGQPDAGVGKEVRDLVRGGVREFGEVIVGDPRAGVHQLQGDGDELLHFAQRLQGLLATLVDSR